MHTPTGPIRVVGLAGADRELAKRLFAMMAHVLEETSEPLAGPEG